MDIAIFHDTFPTATEDYELEYAGFGNCDSFCRIRVYQPRSGAHVAICATEVHENDGTSVTNVAELVFRLAWHRAGRPLPVYFIEHYPGDRCLDMEESFSFVTFDDGTAGSAPGDMCLICELPEEWRDKQSFGRPEWTHASRTAVEAAIDCHLTDYDQTDIRI